MFSSSIDQEKIENAVSTLQSSFFWASILQWVVLPIFVFFQEHIPTLEPDCREGFRNSTIWVILVMELIHISLESRTWSAAKELCSPPEIAVLRQLGVLRSRGRFVVLGVLESLDLYTDLTFPLMALACDLHVTESWRKSWQQVPVLGKYLDAVVDKFRFWGIALLLVSANVLFVGLLGIIRIVCQGKQDSRMNGEIWLGFARSSETSMMPSVAMFCEEMANQKRYVFDGAKDSDFATQAREHAVLGKLDAGQLEKFETTNFDQNEKVNAAEKLHFFLTLFVKVFLGNLMSVWLQGSFMALTFDLTHDHAKYKIGASMVVSAIQALVRCHSVVQKLGFQGCIISVFVLFFLGWSFAKVYFAYQCPKHLWNLTSGCVDWDEWDEIDMN
eukprot:TRINITY_DN8678_c3_g1_i1.p1 TRINITY_DN8678_c3_g1~~TRINITY_DN8678_c3_g1_i1.p1  ORF type:complete len:395 (-),score=44.27 TRINITY_DN8678_c3_g1_i1:72-1232(-)